MKEIGVYIHIPFCNRKCYYCDFVSYTKCENLIEEYIKKLNIEIDNVLSKNKYDIKTVYIGGGTPSLCSIHDLKKLAILKYINKNTEFTIEVNPSSVTKEKLDTYKEIGINRISIGMQSTNDDILKTIGRLHSFEQFKEAYELVRVAGFTNVNVDLMIGLPGETVETVKTDVRNIIKLNPEHISVYSLILEEGTLLEEKINSRELILPSEDEERKMYWLVKELLEGSGYKHYEISNFAKTGFESKHNSDCWNQKEYYGFGVAAHSYIDGVRFSNTENLKKYLIGENEVSVNEVQTEKDKMNEFMLLGLRKIDGVKISEFKNKYVQNPVYLYKDIIDKLVKQELIEVDMDSIKLTNKGIDFANIVWEEFV